MMWNDQRLCTFLTSMLVFALISMRGTSKTFAQYCKSGCCEVNVPEPCEATGGLPTTLSGTYNVGSVELSGQYTLTGNTVINVDGCVVTRSTTTINGTRAPVGLAGQNAYSLTINADDIWLSGATINLAGTSGLDGGLVGPGVDGGNGGNGGTAVLNATNSIFFSGSVIVTSGGNGGHGEWGDSAIAGPGGDGGDAGQAAPITMTAPFIFIGPGKCFADGGAGGHAGNGADGVSSNVAGGDGGNAGYATDGSTITIEAIEKLETDASAWSVRGGDAGDAGIGSSPYGGNSDPCNEYACTSLSGGDGGLSFPGGDGGLVLVIQGINPATLPFPHPPLPEVQPFVFCGHVLAGGGRGGKGGSGADSLCGLGGTAPALVSRAGGGGGTIEFIYYRTTSPVALCELSFNANGGAGGLGGHGGGSGDCGSYCGKNGTAGGNGGAGGQIIGNIDPISDDECYDISICGGQGADGNSAGCSSASPPCHGTPGAAGVNGATGYSNGLPIESCTLSTPLAGGPC